MTDSELEWHRYFIGLAAHAATKSKDPSTKVGCVLVGTSRQVLSVGFNGFPRGVREEAPPGNTPAFLKDGVLLDAERWGRPMKYAYVEHAERNAIYNAARHGIRLEGAAAYLNYAPCPCADCARALVQAGIIAVIGPDIPFPGVGAGSHYVIDGPAADILREGGLTVQSIAMN